MDLAVFRAGFPEFADTAVYPDAQLTFWATVAEQQVVKDRWQTMWVTGVQLYVAHEVTLATRDRKTAIVGGTPGQSGGVPTQKAVGAVSTSYDAATTTEKDAGWWNLTNYGKQFIRLARGFGAGAIQL